LHARNVFLVLNVHTGCVSPLHHCRFNNFFETVKHGRPGISVPMAWQQLSGLTIMTLVPSMEHQNDTPNPAQPMQFGNTFVAPTESPDTTIFFDHTSDMPIFFDQPLQDFNGDQSDSTVNDIGAASHQPSQVNAAPPSICTDLGTSSQQRVHKMPRAMRESVSQQDFSGGEKMHYMASQVTCKHNYDCLHDSHPDLQDHMRLTKAT
jgi:hypothetical protein